jgi:oxygen-independent coproporphyrinogen-3 oxidase
MLGLYLHFPFCGAICSYCNFNRGLLDEGLKGRYVAALEREIRRAGHGEAVDTIYFGGGTPSLMSAAEVNRIVGACRDAYSVAPEVEITLEVNPETSSSGRLAEFREAGVNRLSFGVQSFDDAELDRLGRVHSASRAGEALGEARGAGFGNVSLDLMFWLPGQSRASWRSTVNRAIDLAPDHLSLYLLELYPNAPLRESMARAPADDRLWSQAADDVAADMYLEALEALDAAAFQQYEISNVARPGFESRHNLKYWQAGDWRGFGCGAHSTVSGRRWQNVASTTDYVEAVARGDDVARGRHVLSHESRVEGALFTGLRLVEGIDRAAFAARFGLDPWAKYGDTLAPCIDDGLVWARGRRFGLTRRGMLVANEILVMFVTPRESSEAWPARMGTVE